MEVARVALGGRVTLALFRDDMQEVRAWLLMDAAQDPLDFLLVVAVKGAVVWKPISSNMVEWYMARRTMALLFWMVTLSGVPTTGTWSRKLRTFSLASK